MIRQTRLGVQKIPTIHEGTYKWFQRATPLSSLPFSSIRHIRELHKMVIFKRGDPKILNAYSTVQLTPSIVDVMQHAFWDGSFARYGNPVVKLAIHDRPDCHQLSHYQIRNLLDSEAMKSEFILIDEDTEATTGVWYVESTEACEQETRDAIEGGHPPITHPDETFTLWKIHLRAADVPIDWAAWDVGSGDMFEKLYSHGYMPYDPHNPQMPPASSGVDWTDGTRAAKLWGPAHIKANFSEIEVSTRDEDRRTMRPMPSAMVRLKADVARECGLLQKWWPCRVVPTANEELSLSAPYDLDSPKWPRVYPEAESIIGLQNSSLPVEPQGLGKGDGVNVP